MIVADRVRLPLSFDVDALACEATWLPAEAWVPHFNRDIYEGDWSGVPLRSVRGVATQLYPDPAAPVPYADTEILASCPAHRAALAQFGCPVTSARLLALAPGATIREHRDYRLGWHDGEVRIHVPIITDDRAEFVLDGLPVDLATGEAWYLDLTCLHRAANNSTERRVHLVVDCVVDEWLTMLMDRAICLAPQGVQ